MIKTSRIRRIFVWSAIGAWLAIIAAGSYILMKYEYTPSGRNSSIMRLPVDTKLKLSEPLSLVMFLHPDCPCSAASLRNLIQLQKMTQDRYALHLFFYKPSEFPDSWVKTSLWETAHTLKSARIYVDIAAVEARRFNAVTSGETFMLANDGTLLFTGGLTRGRGVDGKNPGLAYLSQPVNRLQKTIVKQPIFGCSLISPRKSSRDP